jgi:hypothetical protein
MDQSQIETPVWKDKAFLAKLIAPLISVWVAWLNKHGNLGLSDTAVTWLIAGIMTNALAFIAAHKWKTASLGKALIASDGPAPVAAPVAAPKGFAKVRLLVALTLVLSGCATLKAWWAATVDCANQDSAQILALVPGIIAELGDQNWVAAALDGGNIVGEIQACALETVKQAGLNNHPAVTPQVSANAQALSSNIGKKVINAPPLPLPGN